MESQSRAARFNDLRGNKIGMSKDHKLSQITGNENMRILSRKD